LNRNNYYQLHKQHPGRHAAEPGTQLTHATQCNSQRTPRKGIRIEELTELTHHSLVQYRLPPAGELIPLLHIAPSKSDVERLLVISPELADVLAAVIARVRDSTGTVPLAVAYDVHECEFTPPVPVLFQHYVGAGSRPISAATIRRWITSALEGTGITDASGQPLAFKPHDFRRIFATDAIMNGMPPHICQLLMGHASITTTMGYKNSRELHQAGEKPQVSRSQDRLPGVPLVPITAL
jgi:integrase